MSWLTNDKITLSRLNPLNERQDSGEGVQYDVTVVSDQVRAYVEQSIAPNTRRAYLSDLQHFEEWGGKIPATDALLAEYLADNAGKLAVSTLVRRLASISKAHQTRDLSNPTKLPLVKATLQGIKRQHTVKQRQAKPILKEDLSRMVKAMGNSVKDVRDRALLLVGFAGGLRRSELIAINCTDVEWGRHGLNVYLSRSKTDQEGEGRIVAIPFGDGELCPVKALAAWLDTAMIQNGAVFRRVDRHSNVFDQRLSGGAVSLVIKERLTAIGRDTEGYSGHSLRAGYVTAAALGGAPSWRIREQTGHRTESMVETYIRGKPEFGSSTWSKIL